MEKTNGLTLAKLRKFIRIRDKSGFPSNLQFIFDCDEAGFEAGELGNARKIAVGFYEWDTPFGTLIEYRGGMFLAPR